MEEREVGAAREAIVKLQANGELSEGLGEELVALVELAQQAAFEDGAQGGQDLGVAEDHKRAGRHPHAQVQRAAPPADGVCR